MPLSVPPMTLDRGTFSTGSVQLVERLSGVFQVMVHADYVVPAGQLVDESDELSLIAMVDPATVLGLGDADALV